ncbi:MAG: ATP-dependent RNA helicase HrpA [Phycisphaerales bacterium]
MTTPPRLSVTAPSSILPVLERRAEIERAILEHRVVVLCGQTGSGKTTQLPQICLDLGGTEGRMPHGLIGHTQPRRLAARAVALRISEELGEGGRVGGNSRVGVKVRFEDQTGRSTRIKVMTDGVLLAELASDPELRAYGTLIIDEAHERSLNIDLLLGHLRTLVLRRADLKLIITSATIDPRRFSDAFGGPSAAPIIEVSGRMYPVEVRYRPGGREDVESREVGVEAVADACEELTSAASAPGDVLVFLPGEREIRAAEGVLRRRLRSAEVLPLYSRLSNQEQDRIFHPADDGRRRIILATNVAETSLTVPGIRFVVDSGLARINRYDPARKVEGLPIEPISRASADQRMGRCGRVAEGVCIRLYSEESYRARPLFTDPEIKRTSLAGVILRMKSSGVGSGEVETFPFLDPPDRAAVKDGYETLFELGAIDSPTSAGVLTPVGAAMARLPVDPRIARILLAADREGCVREGLVLAAALEVQDPRQRPMGRQEDADRAQQVFRHGSSDFLTLLRLWDQYRHAASELSSGALADWCGRHFVSPARMREWVELTGQLRRVAEELGIRERESSAGADHVHRALLTGLITHAACREGDGSFDYRGVRGNVVQIHPGSALFKKGPKWIIAAELVQTTRLYARTVAPVRVEWIEELAVSDHHLDTESGQPSAWERVTMSGIVVVPRRRVPLARIDPASAHAVFVREGLAAGKWPAKWSEADPAFIRHNAAVLARAAGIEAKLRRRNVIAPIEALASWFGARVPAEAVDPASFMAWYERARVASPGLLELELSDCLADSARAELDETRFPDTLELGDGKAASLDYALSPGKDEDGVTATVELTALPRLTAERAEWLVPGMLAEVIGALIKALPRAERAQVERIGDVQETARGCAEVLTFGQGSLAGALSEALAALHGVKIDSEVWNFKPLPAHLRLRVRVIDHKGGEIAAARDVAALHERLAVRVRKAGAAAERSRFERAGLTAWDFGDLPEPGERVGGEGVEAGFAALIDEGGSVRLTLVQTEREATAHTVRGVRRLFALACREEVGYYLDALPTWPEMTRHFNALGTVPELRDQLTCLIAERAFMEGQSAVRTKSQFEERSAACWGRLSAAAREIGELVALTLEARARVAHRLAGGTPRLWAESIADIREHATYLMPRGFLGMIPVERLRRYPAYAGMMRDRLLNLREDGSKAETDALRRFSPHWKKFTGWVSAAMSSERAARAAEGEPSGSSGASDKPGKVKAPLPQTRRVGAAVNLEAGEWAMRPAPPNLPPAMERYRWALEELRLVVFGGQVGKGATVTDTQVEKLWKAVEG